jgi:UDP-3-O-[3-hydroxymyristoyl] glucosamine N-acyltransferase
MKKITSCDVAEFLGRPLVGEDRTLKKPADITNCGPGDIVWCRTYTPGRIDMIHSQLPSLVLCDCESANFLVVPHICCENPRLDFIKSVSHFFVKLIKPEIHPTVIIDKNARMGKRIAIGPYSHIGPGVVIGDDCIIGSCVSIQGDVEIGNNCTIKPNCVIGAQGFGFERDDDGRPHHFPHLGKIILGENVWIGACTTIERATLGVTKLENNVKVDDLVQIGHNVEVSVNTMIMAGTIICGGVRIGQNCWIAPKSVIKEKITIGDSVIVGLGAVVIRDVEAEQTVAGVPAKPITTNKK